MFVLGRLGQVQVADEDPQDITGCLVKANKRNKPVCQILVDLKSGS